MAVAALMEEPVLAAFPGTKYSHKTVDNVQVS